MFVRMLVINLKQTRKEVYAKSFNSGETEEPGYLSTICTPVLFLFYEISCIWVKEGILK